eukprot:6492384-Amphidinium_carterae.9
MAMGKLLKSNVSSTILRRQIHEHAISLLASSRCVHGSRAYIQSLTGRRRRWGNTIDVIVAADLHDVRFRIIDLRGKFTLLDTNNTRSDPLDIGYRGFHFVAGKFLDQKSAGVQSRSCVCATCQCSTILAHGGVRHGVAGASPPNGRLMRPFDVPGIGVEGRSRHTLLNGHDLVVKMAVYDAS